MNDEDPADDEARLYRRWKAAARNLQYAHMRYREAVQLEIEARARLGTLVCKDMIPDEAPAVSSESEPTT